MGWIMWHKHHEYSWVNDPVIYLHFPGVEIPFISPDIISPDFPRHLSTKKNTNDVKIQLLIGMCQLMMHLLHLLAGGYARAPPESPACLRRWLANEIPFVCLYGMMKQGSSECLWFLSNLLFQFLVINLPSKQVLSRKELAQWNRVTGAIHSSLEITSQVRNFSSNLGCALTTPLLLPKLHQFWQIL